MKKKIIMIVLLGLVLSSVGVSVNFVMNLKMKIKIDLENMIAGEYTTITFENLPGNIAYLGTISESSENQFFTTYLLTDNANSNKTELQLPERPGDYYISVLDEKGEEIFKSSVFYCRQREVDEKFKLTVDSKSYQPGEQITVNIDNAPFKAYDWVGLYESGKYYNDMIDWTYIKEGTRQISFAAPQGAGEYVVRYFLNDEPYSSADSEVFKIISSKEKKSVSQTMKTKEKKRIYFHDLTFKLPFSSQRMDYRGVKEEVYFMINPGDSYEELLPYIVVMFSKDDVLGNDPDLQENENEVYTYQGHHFQFEGLKVSAPDETTDGNLVQIGLKLLDFTDSEGQGCYIYLHASEDDIKIDEEKFHEMLDSLDMIASR